MKNLTLLIILSVTVTAKSQTLPNDVRMDTTACFYAEGFNQHNFYRNNEQIAYIIPEDCNNGYVEVHKKNPLHVTEFFPNYQKDTFATAKEALSWIISSINDYYKPVVVENWQKLNSETPKLSLEYPIDWSSRTENYPIFKSKTTGNNKLVLLRSVRGGNSEIGQIIRTPNTAKLTTAQVMEITAQLNRAIDFKTNPTSEQIIDGKTFKTMTHNFMQLMQQNHYWYADEKEIIYITYGLLKDDRIRYPEVLKQIVQSIKW
ncbi:MAG: hypothetical protein U0W24_04390 [Bacteroidales bacterium]